MAEIAETVRRPGIVTVGSVHMDVIAVADRLPVSGESLLGHTLAIQPGGKAGNQAAQVARLGARSTIIGRIGDDHFGRDLVARLANAGVMTDYLTIDRQSPTGASPIFVGSDGDYASIIVPGTAALLSKDDLERARMAFEGAAIVMLQLELPETITVETAKFARAAGATVMLNASPLSALPCSRDLWPYVDVLVVNLLEARRLAEITSNRNVHADSDASTTALAHTLRETFDIERIVITRGSKGAVAIDGNAAVSIPAIPVSVVNAIGAGDALAGALLVGLANGCSLFDSLPFAVAASAFAVTRAGGGFASYGTQADIRSLMERHDIAESCLSLG